MKAIKSNAIKIVFIVDEPAVLLNWLVVIGAETINHGAGEYSEKSL